MLNEPIVTPFGQLHVDHGNVRLFYKGIAQHNNLLAIRSRILTRPGRSGSYCH